MVDDSHLEYPGYNYLPSADLPGLGYGALKIFISAQPLERFFDAHRAIFPIAGGGVIRKIVVNHPWISEGAPNPCHICAGRFYLYERDGDEHTGFSLGGELDISQDENWVVCRLISPAPIFDLSELPHTEETWLAEKFEGLLARRWASYGDDDNQFASRLESVDPFNLLIACLATLQKEFHEMPAASRSAVQEQYHRVGHLIQLLNANGKWPSVQPVLEVLL
jgi:hypothetical protein